MRYVIQSMVMLIDILLIGIAVVAIYTVPSSLIVWIMVAVSFKVWHEQGGFIAWEPANIKKFLVEAKKIGL